MERVRTTEAAGHIGRRVRLQGWLHQFRELGKVNFLIIRDGWGTFQAIVDDPAALAALRAVQVESVIEVRGVVRTKDGPVRGAFVGLLDAEGRERDGSVTSADGKFRLETYLGPPSGLRVSVPEAGGTSYRRLDFPAPPAGEEADLLVE